MQTNNLIVFKGGFKVNEVKTGKDKKSMAYVNVCQNTKNKESETERQIWVSFKAFGYQAEKFIKAGTGFARIEARFDNDIKKETIDGKEVKRTEAVFIIQDSEISRKND